MAAAIQLSNLRDVHLDVYDTLASEYERRSSQSTSNVNRRIDVLLSHLRNGSSVIDVGCGVGLAMQAMRSRGLRPTGIDLSPRMAEYARRRNPGLDVMVGDFMTADFAQTFDAIWEQALIHLYPKSLVGTLLSRFYDSLNDRGVLSVSTTLAQRSAEGWLPKDGYGNHLRFRKHWTIDELSTTLRSANFEPVETSIMPDPLIAGKRWVAITALKASC
ncbi:class I SAM-dependent methyltransferase [Catellatospora coxensis]|uniref:Methyltransferase n=1 Tax=Catellatospora coxensis TaxID=310354 RepID=A0A8J3L6S3_9ACTN|nr:class I SAM-dependent methyltransferase [Catellatospora coxensis]GIG08950.1 methyltransferase [Catellatospora coxensis]